MTLDKTSSGHTAMATRRMFGSIESIPAKVKAIEAVAEVYFAPYWGTPEVSRPLMCLLEEVKIASQRRNEIAHGNVLSFNILGADSDGKPTHASSGWMLVAPEYMTFRNTLFPVTRLPNDKFEMLRSNYRFNTQDVLEFAAKFDSLNTKVVQLLPLISKDDHTRVPIIVANYLTELAKRPHHQTHPK